MLLNNDAYQLHFGMDPDPRIRTSNRRIRSVLDPNPAIFVSNLQGGT
jgi:hypothetical protein